ncbi:MAG: cyclic di-AMP binding protein CbpA [Limosilactobacillus sp.]|uniref:cyclic di-AMP binding protein CbpA n=1 Tax=Limosilactobacillus sp. TaxID=2773925 RepID=UPI0026FF0270|nr:cyclic di-AMP binding protein CbpA [Limosilactobacillus sp.]
MIFGSLIKKKDKVITLPETASLEEALSVLEDTGYRCVPVLDETGEIFRGNIYRMHLYRHKSRGGDMSLPVTELLKNATKFVSIKSQFFAVFFTMRDLPYIAVLDEDHKFYGIITHNAMLEMLAEGWNVNHGSYVLTVCVPDHRGSLLTASKAITHYCQIVNVLSLDPEHSDIKRILFTLPTDVDQKKLNKIVKRLTRAGFEVTEIQDLRTRF